MNKILFSLLIAAGLIIHDNAGAQNRSRQKVTETLTLSDVVTLARNQSIASRSAATRKENSYWSYRVFRSNYNPQLFLNGTFPDFSHTYDEVRQPDGTYDYKQVNINNSSLNLNLAQSIGQLGTSVYVSSSLRRFDNLDNQVSGKRYRRGRSAQRFRRAYNRAECRCPASKVLWYLSKDSRIICQGKRTSET